jgi:GH35 family endo-1,4-beta-xylanase
MGDPSRELNQSGQGQKFLETPVTRRHFLGMLGVGALALAGCTPQATPVDRKTPTPPPEPTKPPETAVVPKPTPIIEGPTIKGETLSIGGTTLELKTFKGEDVAKQIDAEKRGFRIVTNNQGNVQTFLGEAGGIQVAVLAQAPAGYSWDENSQTWMNGSTVFIPDVLLPGGWNQETKKAGPLARTDEAFLVKDSKDNFRVVVHYSSDVLKQLKQLPKEIELLADGSGIFVGNPKNFALKDSQKLNRAQNGNLQLINQNGDYQEMVTSWINVKAEKDVGRVAAWIGPLLENPDIPYPAEKTIQTMIDSYAKAMGFDGKKVAAEISYQQLKDTKGAPFFIIKAVDGTPLFIAIQDQKSGEWGWRSQTITHLLDSQEIKFGFTSYWKGNKWRKITIPPDALIAENSKVVSPEDAFYIPFIFETPTSGATWTAANEYLSFIKKFKIDSGDPIIVSGVVSNWVLDLEKQHPNKVEARQFFSDLLYKQTFTIVDHFKDDIHGWTINELFNIDGRMNDTIWLRTIGPDYAEVAIKAIRDANPNANIVINEYGLEYIPAKEKAFYTYVRSLKEKGVLRDGDVIGIQGHNGIAFDKSTEQIMTVAEKYIEKGFKVRFTELDVFDVKDQKRETLMRKAEVYNKFMSAAIRLNRKYGKNVVDQVVVWGTTNSSSWLLDIGKLGEYPLLYNDDGTPELTYYLVATNILREIDQK